MPSSHWRRFCFNPLTTSLAALIALENSNWFAGCFAGFFNAARRGSPGMIAANKRLIKVNAKQGVLNIQTTLITIYSNNLSAIATQAALIAGFAFQFVITQRDTTDPSALGLAYFYYSFYTVCLVTALFVLSQATVATVYGPWMAFKSEDNMAVQHAQDIMRSQASFVFKISIVSITSLFCGACIQTWSIYDLGIAAICTFIYVVGYALVVFHGRRAYLMLFPDDDISKDHSPGRDKPKGSSVRSMLKDFVSGTGTSGGGLSGGAPRSNPDDVDEEGNSLQHDLALNKLKLAKELKDTVENTAIQGPLFVRESVAKGGSLRKRFVQIVGGRLNVYKDETDLHNSKDPLTPNHVKLYHYLFYKKPSEFASKFISLGNTLKDKVTGTKDFLLQDVLAAGDVNLDVAYQEYRFAIIPVSVDELNTKDVFEFVATDKAKFEAWEKALGDIIEAYSLMRNQLTTVKDTMLSGGNVTMASYIQAATVDLDRQ